MLNILRPGEKDQAWLVPELFRRAAACYEQAEMWRDAAACWAHASVEDRAAELYLRLDDHHRAAPLLLAEGHYAEALASYQAWLALVLPGNVVDQVTARLGIAACLTLMGTERKAALEAYRAARALTEAEAEGHPFTDGRCWEAVGAYGVILGRNDITQLGYEQSLQAFGEQYSGERIRVAQVYLAAVQENRLLTAEIKERLAKWKEQHNGPA